MGVLVGAVTLAACGDGWEPSEDFAVVTLANNDWQGSLRDVAIPGTLSFSEGCAVLADPGGHFLPVFSAEATVVRRGGELGVRFFDGTILSEGEIIYGGSTEPLDLSRLAPDVVDPADCLGRVDYTGFKLVLATQYGES